ncbi:MAG: outer membrane lipoprotein-sorting protein [Deltaproteobacteria bacterium]|nr:MAG: outer membrane lipoprotein-sorting protein [Deltaproteobacteria bacterium]
MNRLAVAVALALAWGAARPAVALTGREVIDTAQKRNGFSTWRDRAGGATMETYEKDTLARTREVDIVEQTDPRGEHKTFMEFTGPSDVKGSRFLHLSPRGEKDQQWLWTPSARRVRRLGDAQRDENFFGTDLSYRDLELIVRIQQWNDDEARATLESAEETVEGKPCFVVELVPKNDEFPYSRYRLWFGKDDYLLWRVDVNSLEGKVFKRVLLHRYEAWGTSSSTWRPWRADGSGVYPSLSASITGRRATRRAGRSPAGTLTANAATAAATRLPVAKWKSMSQPIW